LRTEYILSLLAALCGTIFSGANHDDPTGMIAEDLTDTTDLGAAAVLVAMNADRDLVRAGEELKENGYLLNCHVTPLGREVAKELRRKGILADTED